MGIDLNLRDSREKIYINKELYGEDRVILINTADANIIVRAKEAQKNMEERISELKKSANSTSEAELENMELTADSLAEIDMYIKEQINNIFDYDVSQAVFGMSSALTITEDGTMYFESFLNAIMPVIEKAFKRAQNPSVERVQKYTAKYKN